MNNKFAQSSLEFLIIFGMGLTLIIVMAGIFSGYFNSEKSNLDSKFIEKIGGEIIEKVEKIYYLGEGNRVTIEAKFPDNIKNISIMHENRSGLSFDVLNITYFGYKSDNSLLFMPNEPHIRFNCTKCFYNKSLIPNISFFNDTSDFSGGNKRIVVESFGEWVGIYFDK